MISSRVNGTLRSAILTISKDVRKHYEGDIKELHKIVVIDFDKESKEVKEKRKRTLKALTKEHLISAVDNYKGNFGDYDYSINNAPFKDVKIKTPTGFKTIENYVLKDGVEYTLLRPNSYIWIKPYVENGLPINAPENQERKIELIEVYFEDVVEIQDDFIEFYNQGVKWKLTTDSIYFYEKTDDGERLTPYSTHYFDGLPIVINGGYPRVLRIANYLGNQTYNFYESIFTPIVPKLDNYLASWSDLKMVNSYHSAPIKQVLATTCKTCDGSRYKKDSQGRFTNEKCDACDGTGYSYDALQSTNGMIVLPKQKGLGQDGYVQQDALKWIEAPSSSLKHFELQEERNYKRMRQSLFLEFEESSAVSGKSREINRKKQDVHYKMIGNLMFDKLQKILEIVQSYLIIQPKLRDKITIVKPLDYSIKSEADLLATVKELPANAPSFIKKQASYDYTSKMLSMNPIRSRINDFLFVYDLLYGANSTEVSDFKMNYIEGSEDLPYIINFHYKAEMFLLELSRQENILEMTNEQLKSIIDGKISRPNRELRREFN